MKIYRRIALVIFFVSITLCAYSDDYTNNKAPLATPYMKKKSEEKSGLTASKDTDKTETAIDANVVRQTKDEGQIKAQSICIGGDCRSKWPSLKCANYDGRPAGETGDEFCGQMNQTCVAVSIGAGQSFFNECSVSADSAHSCRCCWVE